MPVPILTAEHHWCCPACPATDVTRESAPHTRMHPCAGMGGLTVPMVPAGTRAEHRVNERQDYVGAERVQYADGRPLMSISTVRDDGEDVTVFAPTATGGAA